MKIGDLVICTPQPTPQILKDTTGVIVGFNQKGDGGKQFVHVYIAGQIYIVLSFTVVVVKKRS